MDTQLKPKKKWNAGHRIWHWLTFLTICGILGTVLLRISFFNSKRNGVIIQNILEKINIQIPVDSLKNLTHAIAEPMWEWHHRLGFILVLLVVFRIILFIYEKTDIKSLFTNPSAILFNKDNYSVIHKIAVTILYAFFYVATIIMSITGIILQLKESLGMNRETLRPIMEMHEFLTVFFILFVLAHIIGIVTAEIKKEPGIVSDMINGGRL